MQRINIDKVINKLKGNKYRITYIDKIKSQIKEEHLNFFIWKEWIIKINEIWNKFDYINFDDPFWNWRKFNKLKKEFINLIFEEIDFCPNCWKSPFLSTKNLKSFDLDHFFPKNFEINNKKPYKYLTYNFYNLIPICTFCNQKLKKTRNPLGVINTWGVLYNPYFWWIWKSIFGYSFNDSVTFSKIDKHKREYIYDSFHSEFFKLDEIYTESKDFNNDMLFIKWIEDKLLTEKINAKSLKINFDLEGRKDYFFKNYSPQNENEILKFSNWKFKMDLVDNLEV